MKLTKEEQEMLDGKFGYPVQKSMEILVGLGECYDAERMIPINSVHLAGCNIITAGRAGAAFVKEIADKGGKFVAFTDTNITAHDSQAWQDLGTPEDFVREDEAHIRNLERMGAFLCNTCTPYLLGHVPMMGQHVAWGESSAIIFINSFLGARTNRESGPSTLAAALTGRVPAYGYHLDENRYGDLKIIVNTELNGITDYGTLGYFAGKMAGIRVPVLVGVPQSVSWDEMKMLGASAATSGGVALCHIAGVTPEAPTEQAAFGPRKLDPSQTFEFGKKELEETEATLSQATAKEVDLTVIGCPNCSIGEIREIAGLLAEKKLKSGTELWVLTPRMIRDYAEKMGYLEAIEAAGGRIICEVCTANFPRGLLKQRGFKTTATNSAKMVYFISATQDLPSHYGSTSRCIQAAISGVWR